MNHQVRFYVIPGKSRNITVDVSTKQNTNGERVITGVFFEGFNILRQSDNPMAAFFKDNPSFYPITLDQLKDRISNEMVVPISQITLNLEANISTDRLLLESYHTVSK